MSKLSPKARQAVKAAYALKDNAQAAEIHVVAGAVDTAIHSLKAGRFTVEAFNAEMSTITTRFVFLLNNAPKQNNDVDLNPTSASNAFSSKVTDNSKPRTNLDVKASKAKKYYGRDAIRRTKAAQSKDAAKAPGRVNAGTYVASRDVTQTAHELDAYTINRMNRTSVQTAPVYVEDFHAAKQNAPTLDAAIAQNAANAAAAAAKRDSVQLVRDVKRIA
jgi:hypothetical protein